MPVINPKFPTPEELAEIIAETLEKEGEKVNKDRMRMLMKKLFEKDNACN